MPSLSLADPEGGFTKSFEKYPSVKSIYSWQDQEGKSHRVALNDEQVEALKTFKKMGILKDSLKIDFVENPQEFFDPDIVDLEDFSKRVYEFGLYKPKCYPFLSPYKSEWIPSFVIDQSPEDRTQVDISSEEELEELKELYLKALREKKDCVEFKSKIIPISVIDEIITNATKKLRKKREPVERGKDQSEKVLLIRENIDDLEYQQAGSISYFEENFYQPPYLAKEITFLPHQQEGIAWLQGAVAERLHGALLADDMGLGKTLQALSFIHWYNKFYAQERGLYLVVAPVVLLENWESELYKFFPTSSLSTFNIHGQHKVKDSSSLDSGLYLTTYQTLQKRQKNICSIDWDIVVLDEAQIIKTPGNLITNAAKALKSSFALAMTGTPVENTYVDLWCIMDFCAPGALRSAKEFAREYNLPVKHKDTDIEELGRKLRNTIGPYIKRRIKKDVLKDLPHKKEMYERCDMPKEQLNRYLLEANDRNNKADDLKPGDVLRTLLVLREICDHPFLPERQIESIDTNELIRTSAKLQATIKILNSIQEREEKVILFSNNKGTQRLLAKVLREKYGLKQVSIINGDTPAHKKAESSGKASRQQVITKFENTPGFNAIVMSPLAAGVGLNITKANHVIHYTRHWNPARESQATDRVYRIGQDKDVYVYYPMAITKDFDSFDVVLKELLERKSSLASATLYPSQQMEIAPHDLLNKVHEGATNYSCKPDMLGYDEVINLNLILFESACAVIFERKGYDTIVTPKSNDKGADVLCFSDSKNLLLQVKKTSNKSSDSVVGEILKSVVFYKERYNKEFTVGLVILGGLTKNAEDSAELNSVKIFGASFLREQLQNKISLSDIHEKENSRIQSL